MKKLLSIFCVIALTGASCEAFMSCNDPKKQEHPEIPEQPGQPEQPKEPEQPQEPELSDAYYWLGDEKFHIEKIDGMYHVMFLLENETKLKDELAKVGAEISNMDTPSQHELETLGDHKRATVEGDFEKIEYALSLTFYWEPYYKAVISSEIWSNSMFSVRLKSETDYPLLEKMAEENNVRIAYKYEYREGLYYLACTNNSKGNAVELANFFHESGLFKHASPNLVGVGGFGPMDEWEDIPLFE